MQIDHDNIHLVHQTQKCPANEAATRSTEEVRRWKPQRGATESEARSIGGHIQDVDRRGHAPGWGASLGQRQHHVVTIPEWVFRPGMAPRMGICPRRMTIPEWTFALGWIRKMGICPGMTLREWAVALGEWHSKNGHLPWDADPRMGDCPRMQFRKWAFAPGG